MDKGTIVGLLLAFCFLGFILGFINHKKLITESDLAGIFNKPSDQLNRDAQKAKKRMFIGYGIFLVSIALMLAISSIWGPAKG